MIPGFGALYRMYRLTAALDRLRRMPPRSKVPLTKAAHMLGTSETHVRQLVRRYAPADALDGTMISAAALQHALRQAREARKRS